MSVVKVLREYNEQLDLREHKEQSVHKGQSVLKELKEDKDFKGLKVLKEQ